MLLRTKLLCGAYLVCLICTTSAVAQEMTNYSYDSFGRLVGNATSGGPNDAVKTAICFDRADNRTQYVTVASGTPTCAPAPTPTLALTPAPNQPRSVPR